MINIGVRNELIFVNYLNGKKVCNLNILFQDLIYGEFEDISKNDIVYAKKVENPEKTDIILSIKEETKRISLKIGDKNSMHAEPISEFIHFLIINNIPRDIVIKFLKFHYADGTTNGTGNERSNVIEYKDNNIDDFIEINKYFNDKNFKNKCIERFVLKGRNSKNSIDLLILGTVNDFFYLNKDDIIDLINNIDVDSTSIHVGPLFIQPLSRNLNRNPKYEKCRYSIQVKWYNLFDHIIIYKSQKLIGFKEAKN